MTSKPGTISLLEKDVVQQLCSSQVISDLSSILKELVENAIDASATSIEITLESYGLKSISVADDGTGVPKINHDKLIKHHHTSKISTFDDIFHLSTLGFRGEALSALANISEMSILTKTDLEQIGTLLIYSQQNGGATLSQSKPAPRTTGTTITLINVFTNIPVRLAAITKHIKIEYSNLLTLLQSYIIAYPTIKFKLSNLNPATNKWEQQINTVPLPMTSNQSNQLNQSNQPNQSTLSTPNLHSTRTFNAVSMKQGINQLFPNDCDKIEFISTCIDLRLPSTPRYIHPISPIPMATPPTLIKSGVNNNNNNNNNRNNDNSEKNHEIDPSPTALLTQLPPSPSTTTKHSPPLQYSYVSTISPNPPSPSAILQAQKNLSSIGTHGTTNTPNAPNTNVELITQIDYTNMIEISGYVSKLAPKCGRSTTDRQFVFLNGRPIDHPVLLRNVSQIYKQFSIKGGIYNNGGTSPAIYLNLQTSLPYDINVTPNKRKIIIQHEQVITAMFKEHLIQRYESYEKFIPTSSSTGSIVGNIGLNSTKLPSIQTTLAGQFGLPEHISSDFSKNKTTKTGNESINQNVKAPANTPSRTRPVVNSLKLNNDIGSSHVNTEMIRKPPSTIKAPQATFCTLFLDHKLPLKAMSLNCQDELLTKSRGFLASKLKIDGNNDIDKGGKGNLNVLTAATTTTTTTTTATTATTITTQLHEIDSDQIESQNTPRNDMINSDETDSDTSDSNGENSHTTRRQKLLHNKRYEKEHKSLQSPHELDKSQISSSTSINSINSTDSQRVENGSTNDGDIIDQHAGDEKYNYETLFSTAKLSQQPLLVTKWLHLPVKHTLFIVDHLPLLHAMGFRLRVEYDHQDQIEDDGSVINHQKTPIRNNTNSTITTSIAPSSSSSLPKIALASHPSYYKLSLDHTDLSSLCDQLCALPTHLLDKLEYYLVQQKDHRKKGGKNVNKNGSTRKNQLPPVVDPCPAPSLSFFDIYRLFWIRLGRLDIAIASRSCRMSIMIGDALNRREMVHLVTKLWNLQSPWSCPHGRPTIRHVIHLESQ